MGTGSVMDPREETTMSMHTFDDLTFNCLKKDCHHFISLSLSNPNNRLADYQRELILQGWEWDPRGPHGWAPRLLRVYCPAHKPRPFGFTTLGTGSKNQSSKVLTFSCSKTDCQHSIKLSRPTHTSRLGDYKWELMLKDWDWDRGQHPPARSHDTLIVFCRKHKLRPDDIPF